MILTCLRNLEVLHRVFSVVLFSSLDRRRIRVYLSEWMFRKDPWIMCYEEETKFQGVIFQSEEIELLSRVFKRCACLMCSQKRIV